MTAETARQFEALEAQASRIMGVFTRAGHEAVAPSVLQPADVFLDCIGEALRARTYVFTDIGGTELCLRPDLTVPTCRLHLERGANGLEPAKYCYNGAAFRYQPADADPGHPREFRQAGIETFGDTNPIAAEVETLALMVEAVQVAGLDGRRLAVRFGDLELVRALLDAIEMPQRWRERLKANFWQPLSFGVELTRLTEDQAHKLQGIDKSLIARLTDATPSDAEAIVEAYLDSRGIETFGGRNVTEISQNLLCLIADQRATPLSQATAGLIESYVAIRSSSSEAVAKILALTQSAGIDLSDPLQRFQTRLDEIQAAGLTANTAAFSGNFGRSLEYYTGFVFEISTPGLPHHSPIAGGGRYDSLMRSAGSPHDVPAIGAAIHTERLLAAVEGGLT